MQNYTIPVSGQFDASDVSESFKELLSDYIFKSLIDKGLDEKTADTWAFRASWSFKFHYEGDINISIPEAEDEQIDEVASE